MFFSTILMFIGYFFVTLMKLPKITFCSRLFYLISLTNFVKKSMYDDYGLRVYYFYDKDKFFIIQIN